MSAELRRSGRRDDGGRLARITLHACRHTYASLMIAAGVNAKALSTYTGHSSIEITYDRYGHLMPGNEEEAAGLPDAPLGGAAAGIVPRFARSICPRRASLALQSGMARKVGF